MNKVLPNPDNAMTTLERYKEQYKRISSRKSDILEILSSYSCFLGRAILKDPYILEYLSKPKNIKSKKTASHYIRETDSIRKAVDDDTALASELRQYKYRPHSIIQQ